jgi:allophanate hydrolase
MILPSLSLTALADRYASGLTPTALISELCTRIEAYPDPAVWIHRLSREEMLVHARRVEARGRAGQPLYGVPFAIKDNIDLAGVPTTAACPAFAYVPDRSASVVEQLLAAGAIPVGKTNLDQFATGLVGTRSPHGTPRNPFNPDIIPGGSSSGSAVAVSAGLVSFALGTDTAGSGRIPAGFNDLVGLKPTRGALSTRGVVPACRSLDCVSVFTRHCADAAAVWRVIDGFDPADPMSRVRPATIGTAPFRRVGVPARRDLEFFGDAEAERLFRAAVVRLPSLGLEAVEIDFAPFRETAALLYQGPWVAERWAALQSFHAQHAEAFLPVTRGIIEGGARLTAADAFAGQYRLAELTRRAAAEWEKMDVLLVPTAPRPYTLAEIEADPVWHNSRLGTYTNFVNLLDLAALAVPAGFRADKLPHGVTFIAPAWSEPRLLALGSSWEGRAAAAPVSPAPAAPSTVKIAVVGAHLAGQPLNGQLTSRGARLVAATTTSADYRLYSLPNTTPPKPGLVRSPGNGAPIAVEVWELPVETFGSFVAGVPSPLCIGTLTLAGGESVQGFLCEAHAIAGAEDITPFGGWLAWRNS